MNNFYYFITNNWQLVSSVICLLLSLIIFCLKKKPQTNLMASIMEKVLQAVPGFVALAEGIYIGDEKSGAKKFAEVHKNCIELCQSLLGRKLTDDEYKQFDLVITKNIENVLSTPQKKGESNV